MTGKEYLSEVFVPHELPVRQLHTNPSKLRHPNLSERYITDLSLSKPARTRHFAEVFVPHKLPDICQKEEPNQGKGGRKNMKKTLLAAFRSPQVAPGKTAHTTPKASCSTHVARHYIITEEESCRKFSFRTSCRISARKKSPSTKKRGTKGYELAQLETQIAR